MIIYYNDITENVNILLQCPLKLLKKERKKYFHVGNILSHILLGIATMEHIKFALSLNGY